MKVTKPLLRRLVLALAASTVLTTSAFAETLTIASSAGYQTLDAHNAIVPGTDLSIVSQLYTPLLTRTPEMQLEGVLADSWEAVDPTTWKFILKSGITFPNGEPLDGDAVKWNIERVINAELNVRSRSWYGAVDRVEVISPTEINIVTKQPFGALPEQLTMLFMLPPKWSGENDLTVGALGTGPYTLESYTPGDTLVMVAKDDYFGPKPAFDKVVVRIIPDAAARVAGLLAGELDVVTDILPVDVKTINDSGRGTAGAVPSNKAFVLKFNQFKAPMDNLQVRQAINYAIDKQAIIDGIYEGTTVPSSCQILNASQIGFNPDLQPFPYDPDKARALLAESGLAQPISVELEVPTGRYLLAQDAAQAIGGMLQDVGIDVKLTEMEFTSWMSKFWDASDMGQIALLTQFYATNDGGGALNLFHKDTKVAYWADEEFSTALTAARSAVDDATRDAEYKTATARMCDQAATGFLFGLPATYAVSAKVDWQARPDDWVRASEMKAK